MAEYEEHHSVNADTAGTKVTIIINMNFGALHENYTRNRLWNRH